MFSQKFYLYALAILLVSVLGVACGELFPTDDKDKSSGKKLDERIPADWDPAEDWSGSEWEVTEE